MIKSSSAINNLGASLDSRPHFLGKGGIEARWVRAAIPCFGNYTADSHVSHELDHYFA